MYCPPLRDWSGHTLCSMLDFDISPDTQNPRPQQTGHCQRGSFVFGNRRQSHGNWFFIDFLLLFSSQGGHVGRHSNCSPPKTLNLMDWNLFTAALGHMRTLWITSSSERKHFACQLSWAQIDGTLSPTFHRVVAHVEHNWVLAHRPPVLRYHHFWLVCPLSQNYHFLLNTSWCSPCVLFADPRVWSRLCSSVHENLSLPSYFME